MEKNDTNLANNVSNYQAITGEQVSSASHIIANQLMTKHHERREQFSKWQKENRYDFLARQLALPESITLGGSYDVRLTAVFLFLVTGHVLVGFTLPASLLVFQSPADVSNFFSKRWGSKAVATNQLFQAAGLSLTDLSTMIHDYRGATFITRHSKLRELLRALSASSRICVAHQEALLSFLAGGFKTKEALEMYFLFRLVVGLTHDRCVTFATAWDFHCKGQRC